MGRRGPAPTPTKLRILRGNPSRRPLNPNEPQPTGLPTCPTWLDREARAEWRRVAPYLEQLGLLTAVDLAALAAYCDTYSTWRRARLALREYGLTFSTPNGYIQQRPEVNIVQRSLALLKAYLALFGMSPADRSRIQANQSDQQADPFEEFLKHGS